MCISSFVSVIGVNLGIARVSFSPLFSLATGIMEKLLEMTGKKKYKTFMLAKRNLNSTETLVSRNNRSWN